MSAVEPGWYDDPFDPLLARWHDGQAFTAHTIVKAQHSVEPPPPSSIPLPPLPPPAHQPPPPVVVQGSNGMAVAALVLGIVGVTFGLIPLLFFVSLPCGLLGLVFGVVGRRRAGSSGQRKGMATWGLVLGIGGLILGVVGIGIVGNAANDLDKCFDSIDNGNYNSDDC